MKKNSKILIALLLVVVLTVTAFSPIFASAASDTSSVGKLVDSFESNNSTFTLSASSRLFVASESAPTGDLLQTVQLVQRQFAADGYNLDIVWGPDAWAVAGDILVILNPDCGLAAEGYKLDVTSTAMVTAPDVDGLLYGLNMLQKHFRSGSKSIKGFTSSDVPDTAQRAVSLDCGRKYYTKDWICNFIREISWMGYNTIELHFSDDSGFRMDFWDEAYYKDANGDGTAYSPANNFSWLCGSNYTSWTLSAYQNDADKGKYLTTAEVVEILETAKEYHIDVIPAFDSPAHLDYTTWKYEQNYKSNSSYSFKSTYNNNTYYAEDVNGIINYTNSSGWTTPLEWPYYSAVNVKGEQAKAFIFELYIDIANFFKEYAGSTDFSIGADEVQLSTSNLASGYSYAWGFSDFVSYINELNTLLNNKGYTMRMYNDFMGSIAYNASSYKFADNIEILYWDSPYAPNTGGSNGHTQPVSYYVNEGRILYNCIQTSTYYALRISSAGDDARSKNTTWWTFYHATEDRIYNEWYSADISEHGTHSENVDDVPDANLGGAYFLIWCDYACINTETEIWEGCYDVTSKNQGEYYSLLNRMWSNIIKMWNWDINNTVTFSSYETLRDKFGYFPGYVKCNTSTDLPASVSATQAYAADHSALTAALANVLTDDSKYTTVSWDAYRSAISRAQTVNADHGATAEELAAQVQALTDARKALVTKGYTLTVKILTTVNGIETGLREDIYKLADGAHSYEIYLKPMAGYCFLKTSGTTFEPLPSGDGSGYISGFINQDLTVTVWYENLPDITRLLDLVNDTIASKSLCTDTSQNAYDTVLDQAKAFTVTSGTTQADVDAMVKKLEDARTALVMPSDTTQIISIEKLSNTVSVGKTALLRVVTTADVSQLTVSEQNLSVYIGSIQQTEGGDWVKVWLVGFHTDEAGTYNYSVQAESVSQSVTITIE
ncbi:MAG: family 20 glycosylhydrolase [Oscillospiraceae bacterium]|nr:family 20 glycosylhydrolase [Oscillospiraceae bacterium]